MEENPLPDLCICCILTKQSAGYIEKSSETLITYNSQGQTLEAHTLLGVRKMKKCEDSTVTSNTEINYFAPDIKVQGSVHFHLADSNPFSEYAITKQNVPLEGGWMWIVEQMM